MYNENSRIYSKAANSVQNMRFFYTFHFFVYEHGPGARAPHIANDFLLQIRSPDKYIGKVDKR